MACRLWSGTLGKLRRNVPFEVLKRWYSQALKRCPHMLWSNASRRRWNNAPRRLWSDALVGSIVMPLTYSRVMSLTYSSVMPFCRLWYSVMPVYRTQQQILNSLWPREIEVHLQRTMSWVWTLVLNQIIIVSDTYLILRIRYYVLYQIMYISRILCNISYYNMYHILCISDTM